MYILRFIPPFEFKTVLTRFNDFNYHFYTKFNLSQFHAEHTLHTHIHPFTTNHCRFSLIELYFASFLIHFLLCKLLVLGPVLKSILHRAVRFCAHVVVALHFMPFIDVPSGDRWTP